MQTLKKIVIDPFCYRQFDNNLNKSSTLILASMEDFEGKVNEIYDQSLLKEGYAPFCKHLFIKNWTQTPNSILPITNENVQNLYSEYEARTEKELPVLVRYFNGSTLPKLQVAEYLDVILYSKEQIQEENRAKGDLDPNFHIPYEYGIVAIKPQPVDYEIPMNPITMMRNALGKEHGGSGVQLNRELYIESVQFWSKHALVK